MKTSGHIFFEMDPHERHLLVRIRDIFLRVLRISEIVQGHPAFRAERPRVLRDLIIFRHVRIEIIFPVEVRHRGDFAIEHQARKNGEPHRFRVHYRQCAGQPETRRASVRIRRRAEFHRAGAEHLRTRPELRMDFEADGGQKHFGLRIPETGELICHVELS
jgi:hypothetical protein